MKSSSGEHYVGLDHLRALAAFLVFAWHFNHNVSGFPVAFASPPLIPPFVFVDEGHLGVGLFMTLSGYLFAKLLDGKNILFGAFLWNRVLRLLPLLVLVCLLDALVMLGHPDYLAHWAKGVAMGWLLPSLPDGGWSITAEFHFYLMLPVLLWMLRRSTWLPLSLIAVGLLVRAAYYLQYGEVQSLAYWTIVGRIDQFALGMMFFQFRAVFARKHGPMLLIGVLMYGLYVLLDLAAGDVNFTEPSNASWWIWLPTVDGLAFASLIAWYDSSFLFRNRGLSRVFATIGGYSYSIYLLHFFVVFRAARFVHLHVMDLSNFYVSTLWSMLFFLGMVPVGYLSYRFIESPFLRLRRRYTLPRSTGDSVGPSLPPTTIVPLGNTHTRDAI